MQKETRVCDEEFNTGDGHVQRCDKFEMTQVIQYVLDHSEGEGAIATPSYDGLYLLYIRVGLSPES